MTDKSGSSQTSSAKTTTAKVATTPRATQAKQPQTKVTQKTDKQPATGAPTPTPTPAPVETTATNVALTDVYARWPSTEVSVETLRLAFMNRTQQAHGVEELQLRLRDLGFYRGAVDDVPGPQLSAALRDYQRSVGLPPTGHADYQTLVTLQFTVIG